MRITREQAEKNREEIVETASKLFLEHGFDGISVTDLMQMAGFTHGGFYNHFESKEVLAAESAKLAFEKRAELMAEAKDLKEQLKYYLSPVHRDVPSGGCPAAALAGDAARQPEAIKSLFAEGVEGMIQALESRLTANGIKSTKERRFIAVNLLAKIVGAIALARAMPVDSNLRQEILETNLRGALRDATRKKK